MQALARSPRFYGVTGFAATLLILGLLGIGPQLGSTDRYLPHGVCYQWQPNLIRLHLISDILIGLAYTAIPLTLVGFIRKRADLPFNWMFLLFGVFIVACGATHWMEVWTVWNPQYWLSGGVKAVTAAASVPTAILLYYLVPRMLAIPSTGQLRRAVDSLEAEVGERKRVESELKSARDELEARVRERTAELERANAELLRQREELERADRAKDEFLAILSHELRNPIHAIRTNAWLIKSRVKDPDSVRPTAAIDRQVNKLSKLLDDLLDVIKVTAKADLTLQTVTIQEVVGAAVETTQAAVDAHRRDLTVDMPKAPLFVKADPARLEQAIGNLIHNAVKYSGQQDAIRVRVFEEDGQAVVSVMDRGVGIAAEELPQLFNLFAQGSAARKAASGGLGVGLHIARELVQAHGGTIEARSQGVGHGSEFVVRVPLTDERPPAAEPAESPAGDQDAAPALSVLVVEDNRDAADSLASVLETYGHTVIVAYDGPEAMEQAKQHRPDVALVDIGIPGMDGFEVAEAISKTDWGHRTLLVAVTGWGAKADRAKSKAAGFAHHLTKPIDYSTLESLLAVAARRRK